MLTDLEIYEDKLLSLEHQIKFLKKSLEKAQKTIAQQQAEYRNFREKVYFAIESEHGFIGDDYENEIASRRVNAVAKLLHG